MASSAGMSDVRDKPDRTEPVVALTGADWLGVRRRGERKKLPRSVVSTPSGAVQNQRGNAMSMLPIPPWHVARTIPRLPPPVTNGLLAPGPRTQLLPVLMSDEQLIELAADEATDPATLQIVAAELTRRIDLIGPAQDGADRDPPEEPERWGFQS